MQFRVAICLKVLLKLEGSNEKEYGIVIVSHVPEVAQGIPKLLEQVAKNVSITFAGGTDDNEIGTSANKIMEAFESNEAKKLLAFYDLGSAKMNLELAMEMSEKRSICTILH